jgi:hypothetical protein
VSCRVLPASTVEQLEPFFNTQLKQVWVLTAAASVHEQAPQQGGSWDRGAVGALLPVGSVKHRR